MKRSSAVPRSNVSSHQKSKRTETINDYRLVKKLGEGSFAKVKLCVQESTGNQYAMKKMNKKDLRRRRFGTSQRTAYDSAMDELSVLEQLQHPNIIWLHEIIEDCDHIYIVTEYYTKGSLGEKVRKANLESMRN